VVGGGAQRFPHISFPLILDPSPARGEGSNKVTFVRLRFANRTYVADGIAVNRTGVVSDHIPGALEGQFQPVAFGIQEGALVIAVTGPAGAVQVLDLGALEQL